MFGIGTQELLLVLVVVLLLFGGKRVPEVARALGKGMADFRKAMREVQREVDLEMLKTPESDRHSSAPARTEPANREAGAAGQPPVAPPMTSTPEGRGKGADDENRSR